LLSPPKMARYVDQVRSPSVRACLDLGTMPLFGFLQDWIWTMGKRIVRLHFEDFCFEEMRAQFTGLSCGKSVGARA